MERIKEVQYMDVRVCSLPSDSLGSILLQLLRVLHFLASEVSDLHRREPLASEFVYHQDDQDDCQ